jgi:hypothetical protein
MHGQPSVKFCNAQQATRVYRYKNIKTKLFKNNAAIWYNIKLVIYQESIQDARSTKCKIFQLRLVARTRKLGHVYRIVIKKPEAISNLIMDGLLIGK